MIARCWLTMIKLTQAVKLPVMVGAWVADKDIPAASAVPRCGASRLPPQPISPANRFVCQIAGPSWNFCQPADSSHPSDSSPVEAPLIPTLGPLDDGLSSVLLPQLMDS